jgi:hypothetical protein
MSSERRRLANEVSRWFTELHGVPGASMFARRALEAIEKLAEYDKRTHEDTVRLDWMDRAMRASESFDISVASQTAEGVSVGETIVVTHGFAKEALGATLREAIDEAMLDG